MTEILQTALHHSPVQSSTMHTWGINDGVVPLVGEELLGGAGDGHTTCALLLLGVHVAAQQTHKKPVRQELQEHCRMRIDTKQG